MSLTKEQIQKRFECEAVDAKSILAIQAIGLKHGHDGTKLTDEDFIDAVGMDIEHVESLLFTDEGAVRKVYDAAVREGAASARSKKSKAA